MQVLDSSVLELQSINKSYGTLEILKNLDLSLPQGANRAIVGASGSGKTTLLAIAAGIDRPDGGEVVLSGKKIWSLNPREQSRLRASSIGLIFQEYHLIPSLSAQENVSLPLELRGEKQRGEQRALELLGRVGLQDRAKHLPHQLSGGEQQRVAIARALCASPKLLLADEPTGSLDERTAREVEDLLFELLQEHKMSALIITHNRELAKRCQGLLTLQGGRLHEAL